jgi:hypothetical protein
MADKVDKAKKKAKPKKDEQGVLAALPSTRPERIGTRRAAPAAKPAAAKSKPRSAAKSKPRSAAKSKPRSAAKSKPRAATSTASTTASTAARPKAVAPRTFEPTEAAESAAATAGPRPVSEGAPGIGTGGARDERSRESARPSGVELAGTAVKAAGEVAQLGLTIGGHVLKRVVDRLPRP